MIYLDNSATTRTLDEAISVMDACMRDDFYNPAGAYAPAVASERRVNAARARLADAVGASADEVIYTSGGTESNNAAIFGTLKPVRGKRRILVSAVEHPSVYEVFQSLTRDPDTEVVVLPVDRDGAVRLDALADALTADTALVSIMHVNNETGAVNDIAGAYNLIRRTAPSACFHVDGVQAFCKVPFGRVPCDLYTISGHKFHAPKGVGALLVRQRVRFGGGQIGGGQEQGRRSGTTNTPAILGMDAALSAYRAHQAEWLANMRACKLRLFQNLITVPDAIVNGPAPELGAPHILNMSFPGVRGEVLLHALSDKGVLLSTGSACSAHKQGKNRILTAMGVTGARQDGALRFSLCPFNTIEEMDTASALLSEQVAFLRRYQRR